jgi:hypothetical protein
MTHGDWEPAALAPYDAWLAVRDRPDGRWFAAYRASDRGFIDETDTTHLDPFEWGPLPERYEMMLPDNRLPIWGRSV